MRYIEKKPLPDELQEKLLNALENNISWDDFTDGRSELRKHLFAEQSGLCAYSEISLNELGFHIDHIKPKGVPSYSGLRFNHENLLASSPENQGNVTNRDLFGGHKKDNNYDESLFIAPTDANCECFFQYSPNGNIAPKNDLNEQDKARAKETIECLGLQTSRLLKNRRQRLYQSIHKQLGYLLKQPEALEAYKDYYFTPNSDGHLKPFQSVVKQVFSTV